VNADLNTDCVTWFKKEFNSNLFEVEPAFIEAQYKKYGFNSRTGPK